MLKTQKKYFLGANSCDGFISCFSESYSALDGWRAYIIKGGPGTGKSTLMKYVAASCAEQGYETELCPCSSDPDSLDAVIIPELKVTVLDGTAPHVVEPQYPGACERIVDLGEYWDFKKLVKNSEHIICATAENKLLHRRASGYLSACGELLKDNLRLQNSCIDNKKAVEFAKKIASKHIPKKSGLGRETVRFVSGITPKGFITYKKTLTEGFKTGIVIEDRFGGVSNIIIGIIRERALKNGYDVITLKNPLLPNDIIDHIIIPELSFTALSENDFISLPVSERRIHSRRFIDINRLKSVRARMIFNRRVASELLSNSYKTLELAKASHDGLEKYYKDAMDFSAVSDRAESITEEILGA